MAGKIGKVFRDIMGVQELRRRILITFGLIAIFRVGFHVYLPYVDLGQIEQKVEEDTKSSGGFVQWIGYTSTLTGGNLRKGVIFSLGIMPYITASIIFSLLTKVIPRLEALSKEGEHGRRAINRYTRYATVVVAIVQGIFIVYYLHNITAGTESNLVVPFDPEASWIWKKYVMGIQLLCLVFGALFLMWLGEKITEYGIGNGASVLIMAGIISRIPSALSYLLKEITEAGADERPFKIVWALTIAALFLGIVAGVVYITRGQRRIPIQQARTVKGRRVYGGTKHYMPLKVNSAGVMPIIFAQAIVVLPPKMFSQLTGIHAIGRFFQPGAFWYFVSYVVLIVFFSYFWTSLMYNPVEIAKNIKENGSFIPGIRPGKRTAEYLERVMTRVTLAGCVFLAIIALVPELIRGSLEVNYVVSSLLGGTSMLIVVGVALDVVDKVEAKLLVRQYDGFVRGGRG